MVACIACIALVACPRADGDDVTDAGASTTADAGAKSDVVAQVDAGTLPGLTRPRHVADPLAFRFARMRTPTAGGEEIVRIGLHERVRIVDGVVVDERTAPSAEMLARLVELCANRDVEDALRKPGDTAPSMTIIELACAPVQGVLACDPSAPATCAGAFVDVKNAVTAAWQEDSDATRAPPAGLVVRATQWSSSLQVTATNEQESAFVLLVDGKAQLPTKDASFSRAPTRKRVMLCSDRYGRTCTDVVAPALVHADIIGNQARFRCPSCAPARDPRSPPPAANPGFDPVLDVVTAPADQTKTLSKAAILDVMKRVAIPRMEKECKRAAGPDVVKIAWTIEPSGLVKDGRDAATEPTARGRCAASVMNRMKFPASSTSTPITFPVRIGR